MRILRVFLVSIVLAMGGLLIPPVVAPFAAVQATAGWVGTYTDGTLVYFYTWVPDPTLPQGGWWSGPNNVELYVGPWQVGVFPSPTSM